MSKVEVLEEAKLKWPDGIDRTRIGDRKDHKQWPKGWGDCKKALAVELSRLGATSILIQRHEDERLDPGVAVWFSRSKPDLSWQQGLGIDNPAPTLEEIGIAFKRKAAQCAPDRPDGGDSELFKKLVDWRTAAVNWVKGVHNQSREYVIAIDQYKEARWNLKAIQLTFFYIRGLERVGAPAIISQTLGSFRAKLVATTGDAA